MSELSPAAALAYERLLSNMCPIDRLLTRPDYDYDESGEHAWDICRNNHVWPMIKDAGNWMPDTEVLDEKLEEYQR